MKRRIHSFALVAAIVVIASCTGRLISVDPPVAEKIPFEIVTHGELRIDNYYWMRLADEQKNSEVPDESTKRVLDYLNAENAYKEAVMKHTETLQEQLFSEMTGRIKKDDSTVPYLDNGYYYFTSYTGGKEYPMYFRRKASEGASDELLLDVNKLAEGRDYCQVSGVSVSPDNKTLAYGIDFLSRRMYTINFIDIATGELSEEKIENTTGQTIWAGDNRTVFYVVRDPVTLRSYRVMSYTRGGDGYGKIVYTEEDEIFSVGVSRTKSRKYILINSSHTLSDEVRLINTNRPDAGIILFQLRSVNHEFSVDHLDGYFYIRTNSGGASNFRLMKTSEEKTGMGNWTEVIPHRDNVLLQRFELFNGFIAVSERINGLNNIRILNIEEGTDHYIDFGEEAYTAGLSVNPGPDTDVLRYSYSSLTTPNSVIDYNMITRERTIMKEEEVLGGFDKENYQSERVWAKAGDGTMVPVSIVFRKGFEKDGKAPLLLYAYGSYGSSTDPGFRSNIISLLDRGFVYALAHVRGGVKWAVNGTRMVNF